MTALDDLADEIGVSGRTLRRAVERQTIRATPRSSRAVSVSALEYEYVRRHWPLLGRALQVLRTRPGVRLAVLFGSVARGEAGAASDVDLLVRVRGGWKAGRDRSRARGGARSPSPARRSRPGAAVAARRRAS
jgi:hypothetical protein